MSLLWVKTAFSFNCYTCGHKMGDFPPAEALSDGQFGIVHNRSRTMDEHDSIAGALGPGGKFEGMTPHNFCTHCLSAVVNYPKAFDRHWKDVPNQSRIDSKRRYNPDMSDRDIQTHCNDCGQTDSHQDWVQANRAMIRHNAEHEYGDASHLDGLS